jgi:polar amino acid transport system permease protein
MLNILKWLNEKKTYFFALVTFGLFITFVVLNQPNSGFTLTKYTPYLELLAKGFGLTLFTSVTVFILSFILGFIMFLGSRSRFKYIRSIVSILTDFMFGTPMLVVVIVFYFFIGTAFGIDSKLFWGMTSLTLYFAPFMMKLYISAFKAVNDNQFIICDIFGFSKIQMYRYVILPQMIKIMTPPLTGQLATIIKSTSLLYLIGYNELYYVITTVQSRTFGYTEGYILMMVLYLVITIPLIKFTVYLERRMKL